MDKKNAKNRAQKEIIVEKLKEYGYRITKQRLVLLDIILGEDCANSKEIYYKASKVDSSIGAATVYRMVNLLEEIGAINRKSMYQVNCQQEEGDDVIYHVELDDGSVVSFTLQDWKLVVWEGLKACGYIDTQRIASITVEQ
jgi:Fur family ferric uptake transcriptional regulator